MSSSRNYFLILAILQTIVMLGAIPAGLLFATDPSGHELETSTEALLNSPFADFLIPGLFLLIVIGIGHLLGVMFSLRRRLLSGWTGIGLGVILMAWIVLQVNWIGYGSLLQPIFFCIGVIEAILGGLILKNGKNDPLVN